MCPKAPPGVPLNMSVAESSVSDIQVELGDTARRRRTSASPLQAQGIFQKEPCVCACVCVWRPRA